nr:hypothetical protein Iba_chr08eCG1050 [Ipomoea batatas]
MAIGEEDGWLVGRVWGATEAGNKVLCFANRRVYFAPTDDRPSEFRSHAARSKKKVVASLKICVPHPPEDERRLRTATAAAVSTAGKEALGGGDRLAAKPMMMAEHSSGDYGLRRRLRLRLRWLLRRSRPVAAAWS